MRKSDTIAEQGLDDVQVAAVASDMEGGLLRGGKDVTAHETMDQDGEYEGTNCG